MVCCSLVACRPGLCIGSVLHFVAAGAAASSPAVCLPIRPGSLQRKRLWHERDGAAAALLNRCVALAMRRAGLGAACDIARQEMGRDQQHIKRLSERLYNGITQQLEVRFGFAGTWEAVFRDFKIAAEGAAVEAHCVSGLLPATRESNRSPDICAMLQGVVLNGDPQARYWGNVNLSFAYVEGESLLMGLKASASFTASENLLHSACTRLCSPCAAFPHLPCACCATRRSTWLLVQRQLVRAAARPAPHLGSLIPGPAPNALLCWMCPAAVKAPAPARPVRLTLTTSAPGLAPPHSPLAGRGCVQRQRLHQRQPGAVVRAARAGR